MNEVKRIMKNGIVLCYKNHINTGEYKYIDGGNREIEIEKTHENVLVYFYGELSNVMELPLNKEMVIMIVKDNTPQKTVEISNDNEKLFYEERNPSFEDHILSNFIKEELIRGNIEKELFPPKKEKWLYEWAKKEKGLEA